MRALTKKNYSIILLKIIKINNYTTRPLLISFKFIYFVVIAMSYLHSKLNFINIYKRRIIY